MPKYRTTFDDGSSIDLEAANATDAKGRARREAENKTGASSRTDARVKVASVVNLDEEAGPTDPRNRPGAPAPSRGRGRTERQTTDRDRSDRETLGSEGGQ